MAPMAGGAKAPGPTAATPTEAVPTTVTTSSGTPTDAGVLIREGDVTFEPQALDGGSGMGWLCRGSDGAARAQIVNFDNGPDAPSEELRRYIADGKWGFVDAHCRVAIPASWDFVEPFKGGRARVCTGCVFVRDGEHAIVNGATGASWTGRGTALRERSSRALNIFSSPASSRLLAK